MHLKLICNIPFSWRRNQDMYDEKMRSLNITFPQKYEYLYHVLYLFIIYMKMRFKERTF